jgi:hypothetical protein
VGPEIGDGARGQGPGGHVHPTASTDHEPLGDRGAIDDHEDVHPIIMAGGPGGPLHSVARVFYFICVVIGLFCLIALGYGPLTFGLVGMTLAVLAFRSRLRRWWGLPLASAGVAFAASVIAGWGWRPVVETTVATFLVIAAARVAGRAATRRAGLPR